MSVETITLSNYNSAAELCAAAAAAVAESFGWILDDNGTTAWKDNVGGIGFSFSVYSSYIRMRIYGGNGYTEDTNSQANFYSGDTYYIDVFKSEDESVFAIGIRRTESTAAVKFPLVIAENKKGASVGISVYSNKFIRSGGGEFSVSFSTNSRSNEAAALVLMPDITETGGSVFKSLYMVFSCPQNGTHITLYAGGKEYQLLRASDSGSALAAPV